MRSRGLLFTVLALTACRDANVPVGPSPRASASSASAITGGATCLISQIANPATQSPGAFVVGVPANGSECGIAWTMRTPPLINRSYFWGYYFYWPPTVAGGKVARFYVSYDPTPGHFQNGPNEVTFNRAIDIFTSEFGAVVLVGDAPRTFTRRITALDSVGQVLIDTVGGDTITIQRKGIRLVRVYGEVTGVDGVLYPVWT